jgi:peptidyl-prolyl cis-trans isomerase D
MLLKIREKSQGVFAWIILIVICVPFALWGIQNYIGGVSEATIVTVGETEFFQKDVNKAYQQYSQNFAGMRIDETTLKQQALLKLVKDEVLLQHVDSKNWMITDQQARKFIQSLDYFQKDGIFNKKQYQALLKTQGISSSQFVQRIKQARRMEQYQQGILASNFATDYDIEHFFKIQNQQRDIDYLIIAVTTSTEPPSSNAIADYYQQHQNLYQTTEQASIEYVSLSLDDLASKIEVNDASLQDFYQAQTQLYSTKERRKISHILFSFDKEGNDAQALAKAQVAQQQLATQSFATVAAKMSDDRITANKGGDLGLFEIGGLEKTLEEAVSPLKLGEITAPVKSSFGYHLLTVTELVPAVTQSFEIVKTEVTQAFQRKKAENNFYEMAEKLAEVSYENPDNLTTVADAIGIKVQKSALFSKTQGEGIANEALIRTATFSPEVLAGNNSESIELGTDKVVVLRLLQHQPINIRPLAEVKTQIITALLTQQAQQQTQNIATKIKQQLLAGKTIQAIATEKKLTVNRLSGVSRRHNDLPLKVKQAIFKAVKPIDQQAVWLTVALETGAWYVIQVNKVIEGSMSEEDKKQLTLAKHNIGKALAETTFNAVLNSLQAQANVVINTPTR